MTLINIYKALKTLIDNALANDPETKAMMHKALNRLYEAATKKEVKS